MTTPVSLTQPDPDHLQIEWADGETNVYSLHMLQQHCPCASCRMDGKAEPEQEPLSLGMSFNIMTPEEAQPLRLTSVQPVGNYAYAIRFNHGCQHGIYRFELLRQLATVEG